MSTIPDHSPQSDVAIEPVRKNDGSNELPPRIAGARWAPTTSFTWISNTADFRSAADFSFAASDPQPGNSGVDLESGVYASQNEDHEQYATVTLLCGDLRHSLKVFGRSVLVMLARTNFLGSATFA